MRSCSVCVGSCVEMLTERSGLVRVGIGFMVMWAISGFFVVMLFFSLFERLVFL